MRQIICNVAGTAVRSQPDAKCAHDRACYRSVARVKSCGEFDFVLLFRIPCRLHTFTFLQLRETLARLPLSFPPRIFLFFFPMPLIIMAAKVDAYLRCIVKRKNKLRREGFSKTYGTRARGDPYR